MVDRLPPQSGEWIDRSQTIEFEFEGERVRGFAGDTISTAVWASGRHVLGRSFKYHRPRGIFSLSNLDVAAMVDSADEVNIRGDLREIRPGLRVHAVNTQGGVVGDRLKIMDRFGAFTPVGFYYKTFHKPRRLFPFVENRIRQIAGLGRVNTTKHHTATPKDYTFCEVLVVGAGPAGLAAALSAADADCDVLLIEEQPALGGSLLYQQALIADEAASARAMIDRVLAHPKIRVRTRTTAVGHYADCWVGLMDARRLTKARARAVIVATGAYEQPAVFHNNDLPGCMLASAAQRLIRLYSVRPFRKVVLLTSNQHGYAAALDFAAAGISVECLVDLRAKPLTDGLTQSVKSAGIPIQAGAAIYAAKGQNQVEAVEICNFPLKDAQSPENLRTIQCDGIAMCVGYSPADGLMRQAGTRMEYDEVLEQFRPIQLPSGVFAAGRVNGFYDLGEKIQDGRAAGQEAAASIRMNSASASPRPELRIGQPTGSVTNPNHPFPVIPHTRGKNFVDFDEDLQLKDFENAIQEGFDNMELLKRYSTVGMGPSQGRLSNLLALRVLARSTGKPLAGKQISTARPFTTPIPLSHLAGRTFTPFRRTPAHICQERHNAKLMFAGNWIRPEYFPRQGKSRTECIQAEALAVRQGAGLIDLGTLGKMELHGPDSVQFLERVYTGKFASLRIGMARYGLALDESGVIVDDGVIGRLGPESFYFTTTSSGSDVIYRELQRRILVWNLKVVLVNATSQYGAFNLAGPQSRTILQPLTSIDLSASAFPYMAIREGEVAGVPVRLTRIGFVGELGFEIHMPADGAVHIWDTIMEAGNKAGLVPFGVEAQRLLRLEKGHIIITQDTDALTHPIEAGFDWALKMDKPYFVGQRSLRILNKRPLQRRLVGFSMPIPSPELIPKECHLVIRGEDMVGRVTSVNVSPTLNTVLGLAYVAPDQATPGTAISIRVDHGRLMTANVVATPFYDPENNRQ